MKRGFEIISTYQDQGLSLPKRKTSKSAGYDLQAAETKMIMPKTQAFIPTGMRAYMMDDEVLILSARSSLFKKKALILSNGVGIIDADYYDNEDNGGHIFIAVYNMSDHIVTVSKGEAIAQAMFQKYLLIVNDAPENESRKGGFGSTDD